MTDELVKPDAVLSLDDQRARRALRQLDEALDGWLGSSLQLALAIAEAQETRCWEECDDFTAQRDTGVLKLATRSHGADREPTVDWLATYCHFRGKEIASAQARNLGLAGRAYRLLELGISVATMVATPPMPQNERQLRPLTKALAATYRGKPVPEEDLAANLAECWETALERNENDPAKAAAAFPAVARQSGFKPLANRYKPVPKDVRDELVKDRWQSDVERLEREYRRLFAMSPAGGRALLARLTEWTNREEMHRG